MVKATENQTTNGHPMSTNPDTYSGLFVVGIK